MAQTENGHTKYTSKDLAKDARYLAQLYGREHKAKTKAEAWGICLAQNPYLWVRVIWETCEASGEVELTEAI